MEFKPKYLILCLALAAGCGTLQTEGPECADSVEMAMDFSVRLSSAYADGETPEKEMMSTLRVIIFRQDGSVEHNELVYDDSEHPVEEIADKTFRVINGESKTIYLLANAETLPDPSSEDGFLDLTTPEGLKDRIEAYDGITPEYLQEAQALPMSSSYTYNVRNQNVDCSTLYVVPAAVKFTFTFTNEMEEGSFGVSSLTLNSFASTSWLYPQDAGTRWLSDLLAGKIVTSYSVPSSAEHQTFAYVPAQWVVVENGKSVTLPPLYLTESMNLVGGVQTYTMSILMGPGSESSDDDRIRDVEIADSEGKLNSLFRGTHVDVEIIVKSLDVIEIIKGIYGMIVPWEELEPVDGTITEVTE